MKCRKSKESENLKVARTKNGRIMLLSKWALCNSTKSKFIKEQEAGGLLSSLEIKTHLSKISVVGPFSAFNSIKQVNTKHKMNETVNKFLLAGGDFMSEMYLRQPGFKYSAYGPFTKSK